MVDVSIGDSGFVSSMATQMVGVIQFIHMRFRPGRSCGGCARSLREVQIEFVYIDLDQYMEWVSFQ